MSENRYVMPGWIAIAQAILFPLAFGVGIIEEIVAARAFGFKPPIFGVSDIIMIISTIMGVYVLNMFRTFLKERYAFDGIDTLLLVSIWWMIAFQVGSLFLTGIFILGDSIPQVAMAVLYGSFIVLSMIVIGVVDIMIGIRMLREKEQFSDLLKALAYLSLVAGILEVSVILSVLALIAVPATMIILGLIFLRDEKEVEFV